MNSRDWCLEDVDAFEKERPLLRKENRETLVRSNDKLIRFDLGEVRIDCEIYSDGRTRNELRSHTEIETDWFIDDATLIVDAWYAAK